MQDNTSILVKCKNEMHEPDIMFSIYIDKRVLYLNGINISYIHIEKMLFLYFVMKQS